MIRIATAECFTHGKIGLEIHSFSRGYNLDPDSDFNPAGYKLSLVCALFIPTLSGVKDVLGFEPLEPDDLLDGIKVYSEEKDGIMAVKMADAVKTLTGADIGIGSTAGIGRGGIAVASDTTVLAGTSNVYSDLRTSDTEGIIKRQKSGIKEALLLLERVLNEDYPL